MKVCPFSGVIQFHNTVFHHLPNSADENITAPYFYSTYSTFTGSPITSSSSEPQLDTLGMFLMGCYHLYLNTATRTYLFEISDRILNVTLFLLNVRGYDNLIPADYSIWGENTNQSTGDRIDRSYYAWTQAFGYAGLQSASKVRLYP